jgi:hypothetical protein
VPRWADLSPARRTIELDKIGTTTEFVLLDFRDAVKNLPALENELDRCKTDEEREQLAFEYFEDHPQPTDRTDWPEDWTFYGGSSSDPPPRTFRTPDWPGGRLPRLEDDEPPVEQPHGPELRRREATWPKQAPAMFSWAKIQNAVRYFVDGSTRNDVAAKAKLPLHDATRVRKMWANGLLHLNEQGKLVPDPRVRQVKNKIALRYWDDESGAWLDPRTTLS